MSEEFEFQENDDANGMEYEEFEEEISSEEVDRVLETLETTMAGVESESIRQCLEVAYNEVFHLIYDEVDDADDDFGPEAEAA